MFGTQEIDKKVRGMLKHVLSFKGDEKKGEGKQKRFCDIPSLPKVNVNSKKFIDA